MHRDQLALQLYTVREACARDFLGTLREVAAIGYRAVELAGLHDHPPAHVRAALDEHGLQAVAAHISLERFERELDAVVAELQTLGCAYAVVPWAPEARRTDEGARELALLLNIWGRELRAAGLRLAYHHHDFEFRPLGPTTMWELLVAGTDPALVELELDVYWVRRAGHDPVALLGRLGGRVPLIHLKDLAADGRSDAPAGAGTLDWDVILPAAAAAGAQWYIAEQDHPHDPLADSRRAYELMAARGAQ